jgi:LysM repeat protein
MSGIRSSFNYFVIALILVLILSACERPLQSDDADESEEAATEVVATAVTEEEAASEQEEEAAAEEEEEASVEADEDSAESEEAEADHEPEADEVEAEHEDASEDADAEHEADSESPRPAEGEEDTDAEASEEADADTSDPDVGGGTPDTAEEAPESEASEAEVDAESADEPEAAAEEDTTDVAEAEAEATDDSTEAEEVAASEDSAETQQSEDEAAVPVESTLPATHTVQPGENLYRIGLQYGLSWVTLARYNNIYNPNYVYAGQVLQIPGGGNTPPPQPDPVPPVENPPNYVNYTVKPGDTLGKISRAFGVHPEVIAEVNGIVNPNLIYAGQVLKIPTSSPETPPATTHVVQRGETLYRISLQYGVHWLSIAQANNIWSPYVIYAGQTLVIPGG